MGYNRNITIGRDGTSISSNSQGNGITSKRRAFHGERDQQHQLFVVDNNDESPVFT